MDLDPDPDPAPDPLVRGTYLRIRRIRIRNKMSRIPNTAIEHPKVGTYFSFVHFFRHFHARSAPDLALPGSLIYYVLHVAKARYVSFTSSGYKSLRYLG